MSSDTGAGVIDQELWGRVGAAIPAVNAAIDRHLAAGGLVLVPAARVPALEAFDSGCPR